jgi:hypothetical protein
MTQKNQTVRVNTASERERALEVIRERKAELDTRVPQDVKDAAKKIAERYEHDLRELAKR